MNTAYFHPINFIAPEPRDMFDANNKACDYLFHALCQSGLDRVHIEECRSFMSGNLHRGYPSESR
jgi:hypothetical protein